MRTAVAVILALCVGAFIGYKVATKYLETPVHETTFKVRKIT